jgi:hypothetical protein
MDAISIVRIALDVVAQRLLIILALGLSFGLSCWVCYAPSWERLTVMAFFSIFSYLIINTKEGKSNDKGSQASE